MLTRLRLDNYRCFDAFDQALGDYVVLVGANGSGKSTLLDSLVLLGDLAGARTCNEAFLEARKDDGGPRAQVLAELLHRGRGSQFTLEVEALAPSRIELPLTEIEEVAERGARPRRRLLYRLTFELQQLGRLVVGQGTTDRLASGGIRATGPPHRAATPHPWPRRPWPSSAPSRTAPEARLPTKEFRFELPADQTALSNLPAEPPPFRHGPVVPQPPGPGRAPVPARLAPDAAAVSSRSARIVPPQRLEPPLVGQATEGPGPRELRALGGPRADCPARGGDHPRGRPRRGPSRLPTSRLSGRVRGHFQRAFPRDLEIAGPDAFALPSRPTGPGGRGRTRGGPTPPGHRDRSPVAPVNLRLAGTR